uniref:VLIG-type G domain-containing protein n=1 Tax=Labrus bergylta TaxID=56723 RepID=A0A3Q3GML0_9LABR
MCLISKQTSIRALLTDTHTPVVPSNVRISVASYQEIQWEEGGKDFIFFKQILLDIQTFSLMVEVFNKLGLEAFWTKPLDPASMLDISTWNLENQAPLDPKDLPNAFLQRLWLLSPDARSPLCKAQHDVLTTADKSSEEMINGFEGENQCEVNPLDLVSAVFMSANSFLHHEMAVRMVQCQFAVPLVLPNIDPEEPSHYLLWPLRGVLSQWRSHFPDRNGKVQEGDLASTPMPVISCVKLGHCGVSKSQVLNTVIGGETFLHRGMDGGQTPRRLSNGLVEIGWYLPTGDLARDIFPVPVVISNLRGDASTHEKHLSFLCQASSAVVIFCGDLREKEKQLLASCNHMANKLILIDLSDKETTDNRVIGFADQNLSEYLGLPEGSVIQANALTQEELSSRLSEILKDLLPDKLKLVTLETAAKLAEEQGLSVDEGAVCKKAMAKVEEVLKGLDEGSAKFRDEQLPLQGSLWSKLAKIEKEEKKHQKESKEINSQLQQEKKDILVALNCYKMTPDQNSHSPSQENGILICQGKQTDESEFTLAESSTRNSAKQQMFPDVSFDHQVAKCSHPSELEPSWLGLEHFLREMGLIFELTHISPGSGSHNVLRLPSVATDLLLHGIPLELMDGDASNIPIRWLACVLAELKRRLPQDQCRTRVLTNLGVHHAQNAEVLSALFGVKFPEGRKRSTRGLYMAALCLPDYLRQDMECDFLFLVDAEGLCSKSLGNKGSTLIHDNEMATVATGFSDVLMHNISSHSSAEFETNFTVIVNALLRIKESASIPICQLLVQDEGINNTLQTSQLRRVSDMLQIETQDQVTNNTDHHYAKTSSSITYVKGPWQNRALSQPVDTNYSNAMLKLKQNLFGDLWNKSSNIQLFGVTPIENYVFFFLQIFLKRAK